MEHHRWNFFFMILLFRPHFVVFFCRFLVCCKRNEEIICPLRPYLEMALRCYFGFILYTLFISPPIFWMVMQFFLPTCDTLYGGVLLPTYFWTTISTITFVLIKYSFQFMVFSVRTRIEFNVSQERTIGSTYRIVPRSSAGSSSALQPGVTDPVDISDGIEMRERNEERDDCKHDDNGVTNGNDDVENVLAGGISPKPMPVVRTASTKTLINNEGYCNLPIRPKTLIGELDDEENEKLKEYDVSESDYRKWVNIFDPESSTTNNNYVYNLLNIYAGKYSIGDRKRGRLAAAAANDREATASSMYSTQSSTLSSSTSLSSATLDNRMKKIKEISYFLKRMKRAALPRRVDEIPFMIFQFVLSLGAIVLAVINVDKTWDIYTNIYGVLANSCVVPTIISTYFPFAGAILWGFFSPCLLILWAAVYYIPRLFCTRVSDELMNNATFDIAFRFLFTFVIQRLINFMALYYSSSVYDKSILMDTTRAAIQNQCFFAHMGSSITNVFVVFIMGVVK